MGANVKFSIDPAVLLYLEDRIKGVFGHDAETKDWNDRLGRRMLLAAEQARFVKCVGMDRPNPIDEIYQPIGLRTAPSERYKRALQTDVWKLLDFRDDKTNEIGRDGIIFAGPGRGKSTLLNWLFMQLRTRPECAPFLFLLRTDSAVSELTEFVRRIASRQQKLGQRPILLVDGYDEIDEAGRKTTSSALMEFKAMSVGTFFLTCRTFYDVYELNNVSSFWLDAFNREDARKFVAAFAKSYEVSIDPDDLIRQLEARDLMEFVRHPLMLTLVCILKTGPLPELPRRSLDLLGRAFDTLTLRWDQQRGIHRQPAVPLDGSDRVKVLMRVAFMMRTLIVSQESVESFVNQYLRLIQRRHIDARKVLIEVAQWYGVLVPNSEHKWQFIHRSIHDYLAARHWIESGRFDAQKVSDWNYRAAYAACLSPDATIGMVCALRKAQNIQAFSECLLNQAPFDIERVAPAVLEHFERYRPFTHHRARSWLTVQATQEFFELASIDFLYALLLVSMAGRNQEFDSYADSRYAPHDVLIAYTLAEFKVRRRRVDRDDVLVRRLRNVFGSDFQFQIRIEKPFLMFKLREIID
jgi:hypothetical protein